MIFTFELCLQTQLYLSSEMITLNVFCKKKAFSSNLKDIRAQHFPTHDFSSSTFVKKEIKKENSRVTVL